MDLRSFIYVNLIGFVFGFSIVASRFAVGQFDPIVYTGLRMILAFIAFGGFYIIARQRYPFPTDYKLWGHPFLLGLFGMALPMACFIAALQYLSSGISAIFVATSPALIALLAHFLLPNENLNAPKSIGILFALSGALLIILSGENGLSGLPKANPLGYGLLIISVLSHCAATIYMRKYAGGYKTFDVTSIQTFTSMIILLGISGFTTGFNFEKVDFSGILALLYSGLLGTFAGFLLYNFVVKYYGATTAAMSMYIVPVTATLGGVLLLGETITLRIAIGMVIILVGVTLVNYGSK